jgi:hypothetical protein
MRAPFFLSGAMGFPFLAPVTSKGREEPVYRTWRGRYQRAMC